LQSVVDHDSHDEEDLDDEEQEAGEKSANAKKPVEKRSVIVSVLILLFSIPALVGS